MCGRSFVEKLDGLGGKKSTSSGLPGRRIVNGPWKDISFVRSFVRRLFFFFFCIRLLPPMILDAVV